MVVLLLQGREAVAGIVVVTRAAGRLRAESTIRIANVSVVSVVEVILSEMEMVKKSYAVALCENLTIRVIWSAAGHHHHSCYYRYTVASWQGCNFDSGCGSDCGSGFCFDTFRLSFVSSSDKRNGTSRSTRHSRLTLLRPHLVI